MTACLVLRCATTSQQSILPLTQVRCSRITESQRASHLVTRSKLPQLVQAVCIVVEWCLRIRHVQLRGA